MKNLFTYLLLAILALINSNIVLAQYSYANSNVPCFFYPEPINPLNLSRENNLGINTNVSSSFNIYPNLNNGKFCIDLKEPKSKMQVDIYNVWGQKIYESSTLLPLPTNEIDFSTQPKGVYFVKINDGEKSQTEKIVIR
jgi:hypothetical protein